MTCTVHNTRKAERGCQKNPKELHSTVADRQAHGPSPH